MVGIAVTLAAAITAAAVAGVVVLARRRTSRPGALSAAREAGPAGVRHLAARMSELSDTQIHLPFAGRALSGRHRLGARLGLR